MKKIKSLVAVSLALCMVLCFAGCSSNHDEGNLKDNLVNGFNNWLESFSKHAVTKDKNLQGERENTLTNTQVVTQLRMTALTARSLFSAVLL